MTRLTASVELVAQLAMPKGVERFRIKDRAMWHALRGRDITASVIGALVDAHEYTTAFELWALKSGKVKPDTEETAAMERGTLLEPVAVELIRKRHPDWKVLYPVAWYYREPANRIGCTPDVFVIDPSRSGFGNYQIKSVESSIFRRKWRQDDDVVEPPFWIGLQTTTEATLTGASWSMVGALVVGHGLDLHEAEIPIHAGAMGRLRRESLAMWRRIEQDDPPPADYAKDGETIASLYADADEGLMIDLRSNNRVGGLLERRLSLQARVSDGNAAEKDRKAIDAELLHILGDAAYGSLPGGRVLCAKTVTKRPGYTAGSTYRTITIQGDRNSERSRQNANDRGQFEGSSAARGPF